MNKKEKSNTNTTPTDILQNITTTLQQTKTKTFTQQIQLYGTINYTRTQYLPQLSQKITENPQHKNKFYNYTTLESMINDLLEIIELNTINQLENTTTKQEKTQKMIQLTTTLLKLLQQTLTTQEQKQEQITQQIQQTQNQYYQLIYNEHSNKRIK